MLPTTGGSLADTTKPQGAPSDPTIEKDDSHDVASGIDSDAGATCVRNDGIARGGVARGIASEAVDIDIDTGGVAGSKDSETKACGGIDNHMHCGGVSSGMPSSDAPASGMGTSEILSGSGDMDRGGAGGVGIGGARARVGAIDYKLPSPGEDLDKKTTIILMLHVKTFPQAVVICVAGVAYAV